MHEHNAPRSGRWTWTYKLNGELIVLLVEYTHDDGWCVLVDVDGDRVRTLGGFRRFQDAIQVTRDGLTVGGKLAMLTGNADAAGWMRKAALALEDMLVKPFDGNGQGVNDA